MLRLDNGKYRNLELATQSLFQMGKTVVPKLHIKLKGPLSLEGHTHYVVSVAFFPNGKRIASASFDGTARIWRAPRRPLFTTNRTDRMIEAR